ncbi:MAG: hypothetical protein ACI4ED_07160 [Suilimivivens sp.]
MNRYPTDEALNRMIEELEKEELYAPGYLKDEILLKVKETEKTVSKRSQPVSFLMYTLKMAAGMAAAVLLVFMIPAGNGSDLSRAEAPGSRWNTLEEKRLKEADRVSLDEKITVRMEQKREEADKMFEKIGNLFRMDLGGNQNES